jgi:hypothetical protein
MRPSTINAIKAKTIEGFYGALDREKVPLRMVIIATLAALREAMPMAEAYGAGSMPGYDIVESLANRIEERPDGGRVGARFNESTLELDHEEEGALHNEAEDILRGTYDTYWKMTKDFDPGGQRKNDRELLYASGYQGKATDGDRRFLVAMWIMQAAVSLAQIAWYDVHKNNSYVAFSAKRIADVFFACGSDRSPASPTTAVADARVIRLVKQSIVQQILAAAQPRSNPSRPSMIPPVAVQRQFAEGLRLLSLGLGGDGLRGETVQWAERLASGESVSPDKARLMVAWFARHGASPLEVEARRRQANQLAQGALRGRAPALVAWLLWGGDAGRAWASRLVAPRPNPVSLDHCVESVLRGSNMAILTSKEATSRAFAICTSSFQRAGYFSPGTRTLTPAGKNAERRHRRHHR